MEKAALQCSEEEQQHAAIPNEQNIKDHFSETTLKIRASEFELFKGRQDFIHD
jgi:hypothetical protein